jgi:hypothetical protein
MDLGLKGKTAVVSGRGEGRDRPLTRRHKTVTPSAGGRVVQQCQERHDVTRRGRRGDGGNGSC